MANNRLFLKCDNCGKLFMLGKRMGEGYYIQQEHIDVGLQNFYDDHEFCGDGEIRPTLDVFSLEYEVDRG